MNNMKLKELVPETIERINKYIIKEKFVLFLQEGKENHWYTRDFNRWGASHLQRAIYSPEEICEMYHKYNCNDDHIYTLIRHCMKETGII